MRRFKVRHKKKKSFRIIGVFVTVLVVVASIVAPCFSMGAAMTATDIFMSMWSVYASQAGIDTVFSTNGILNNKNNTFSNDAADDAFSGLYSSYNSTLDAQNQMSIADWASWALSKSSTVASAANAHGYNMILNLGADVVRFFDGYTTWLLEEQLHATRSDSNSYHTSGTFASPNVYTAIASGNFISTPVSEFNFSSISTNGLYCGLNNWGHDYWVTASTTGVYTCLIDYGRWGYYPCWLSESPFTGYLASYNGYNREEALSVNSTGVTIYYCIQNTYTLPADTINTNIPIYASVAAAQDAFAGGVVAGSKSKIDLRPKDQYNEGVVNVPDTTDTGYIPDTISVPIPDTYVDGDGIPLTIDQVLAKVKELLLANEDVEDVDTTPPDPVIPPVYIPEFPGNINFNFSFSGIWHYVVEWMYSLGSGFTFFGSIWSSLPWAMVVPIYASLVVVIVMSIFKRFV